MLKTISPPVVQPHVIEIAMRHLLSQEQSSGSLRVLFVSLVRYITEKRYRRKVNYVTDILTTCVFFNQLFLCVMFATIIFLNYCLSVTNMWPPNT